MTLTKPSHVAGLAALALATMVLFDCSGDNKPDGTYGDFRKGVADKSHHKKGYGFND